MHSVTESPRLWFDAAATGMNNAIFELHYLGRTGRAWAAGRAAYVEVTKMRDGTGQYLFSMNLTLHCGAEFMGLPIALDHTVPSDTLELRDGDGRIVGKVYNIG